MRGMLLGLVFFLACLTSCIDQFQHLPRPPSSVTLSPNEAASPRLREVPGPSLAVETIQLAAGSTADMVALQSSSGESCSRGAASTVWQLEATVLTSKLELRITTSSTSPYKILIAVAQTQVELASPGTALSRLAQSACAAQHQAASSEVEQALLPLLSSLAPSCAWHWQQQGFVCSPAAMSEVEGNAALSGLKNAFLGLSARPPYVLLRRLSMLEQLGEIAAAPPAERSISSKQFCRGLEQSLASEKPLVMNSPLWKQAFCAASSWQEQEQAYGVGLHYGIAELSFLKHLAASSTRKGRLSIQLPQSNFEDKELWLKLEAEADVGNGIWQQALEQFGPGFVEQLRMNWHSRWHPLFSASPEQITVATILGLLKSGSLEVNKEPNNQEAAPALANAPSYLSSSLLGETTFSLSNGHFKVLHLPLGHYRYTLYDLPVDDANWAPTQVGKKSQGSLAWNQPAPQPIIASWEQPAAGTTLVESPVAPR